MNVFRGASLKEKCSGPSDGRSVEILAWLKRAGHCLQCVYTYKGINAHQIFARLVFMIISQKSSQQPTAFERKAPQGGSFHSRLRMRPDKQETYYIGDWTLDVMSPSASGIQSINFCDYRPEINQKIEKLVDITIIYIKSRLELITVSLACFSFTYSQSVFPARTQEPREQFFFSIGKPIFGPNMI